MLSSNISSSNVKIGDNQISNSGNSIYNIRADTLTVHASTSASGATQPRDSFRDDFEEFKIPVKLPFHKNQNFCGRGPVLDELDQILHPPNASGNISDRKTAILYGMGGIGKSQIALEYAHCDRLSRDYTSIFWIDADSDFHTSQSAFEVVKQLVSHYARQWRSSPDYSIVANTLGIPGKIDDSGRIVPSATETALEAVHNWLGKKNNRGWLLLVDNKDWDADNFNKLLPSCNWGSVIVTSRLSNLQQYGYGQCIEIEGIGVEAGLELL